MIRAFLFDIGNVLVRFDYGRVFRRLEAMAGAERVAVAEPVIRGMGPELESGRLTAEAFVDRAVDLLGPTVTAERFREVFNDIFTANEPMHAAVESLRGRVPLHLFSNTSELHERHLFERFPVFDRFDGGFYSWRAGCMKPDEAFYHLALETLGLPPEAVAYVDDLPDNAATGRRLGLVTHAYHPDRHEAFEEFLAGLLLP